MGMGKDDLPCALHANKTEGRHCTNRRSWFYYSINIEVVFLHVACVRDLAACKSFSFANVSFWD
jgi:hypothetical protein